MNDTPEPAPAMPTSPKTSTGTPSDGATVDGAVVDGAVVDGAVLLDRVRAVLLRYVVLPLDESADAVVLWIAATYGQRWWAHAARLVIRAPEKRCGKSRLLDIVEALACRPLITVNASPAAVYRAIGAGEPPTLLIDEADTIFGVRAGDSHEDLRGLLNAGHQRNRPALRYDAARQRVEKIPTFAMAALAGIGTLPDTIEDRAVVIRMRRRAPGEDVAPYRHRRDHPTLAALARELNAWVRAHARVLEDATPAMPVEDRAADTWEALVAIADLAGGHWPARARRAAVVLTADRDNNTDMPIRVRLLHDCRAAFGGLKAISTSWLLDQLRADPEAPWADHGPHGLTARRLASMLREYDITSGNVRLADGTQAKGYRRVDFADAWQRYCLPDPCDEPDHVSVPIRPSRPTAGQPRDGFGPWDGLSVPEPTPTPPHANQSPHNLQKITKQTERHQGANQSIPSPWDGLSVPPHQSVPGLTCDGTAGTDWDGYAATTCIHCRQPLTHDDGTHTHPTCIPA